MNHTNVATLYGLESASGQPFLVMEPRLLLDSPYKETWGVFSSDDRYLAYVSDESGRDEVYVTDFPGAAQKWAVTNEECNLYGGATRFFSGAGIARFRWRSRPSPFFTSSASRW